MLQHESETTEYESSYEYGETDQSAQLEDAGSELLEDYLDQVCAPLVGKVRRSKRVEIRSTVRLRIEQFAAAHRELGSSQEESIELALAQCGEPALITRRWLPNQSVQVSGKRNVLRHTLATLLFGPAKWATFLSLFTLGLPYLADVTKVSGNLWATGPAATTAYYRIWLFAIPLLAGLLTGLAARDKPVRGVVNALAILVIPAIVIPGLCCMVIYGGLATDRMASLLIDSNPLPGVTALIPWLVLGCAGAGIGLRVRNKAAKLFTRARRVVAAKPARPQHVLHVSAQ